MKNYKLECIDKLGQDSMSVDVYVEEDQYEEFDDFDPYFFIKKTYQTCQLLSQPFGPCCYQNKHGVALLLHLFWTRMVRKLKKLYIICYFHYYFHVESCSVYFYFSLFLGFYHLSPIK